MSVSPPTKPEPHHSPVVAALEIRVWSGGNGYTKAAAHWMQGLKASRTAQRTEVGSFFRPGDLAGIEDAIALLEALLQQLKKSG